MIRTDMIPQPVKGWLMSARRQATAAAAALREWSAPQRDLDQDAHGPSLTLWFLLIGFFCILGVGAVTAWQLSSSMREAWIAQDAALISDFVQSAAEAHDAETHLTAPRNADHDNALEALFAAIANRDPIFRAHFYDANSEVVWSSDPEFIGKRFTDNGELRRALAGETTAEASYEGALTKGEHLLVPGDRSLFVETYVPVIGAAGRPVGVIELYRAPDRLEQAIARSTQLIWTGTMIAGLLVYVTLGGFARWGDARLARSAEELADARGMAAIGEVASAVAHGLRNPLAAMRSSAELALYPTAPGRTPSADAAAGAEVDRVEALREIMRQTDRLDSWIKGLLNCLRTDAPSTIETDAQDLIAVAAEAAAARAAKAGLTLEIEPPAAPLPVAVNPTAIGQALECLIANAMEATPPGGRIVLSARPDARARQAALFVQDSGPGLKAGVDPFRLFLTTKGAGLGVGLPIAKRIVRRHGGDIELTSAPAGGAIAAVRLPLSDTQRE